MNNLLRPRIWPSFPASSGVPSTTLRTGSPCDVPFRYASDQSRGTVTKWHDHLRGLATAIHETSGLDVGTNGQHRPFGVILLAFVVG
jgi:hypothetical protein